MSETKPQKRLVSKGRYVRVMGKKIGLRSIAIVGTVIGMAGGLLAALCLIGALLSLFSGNREAFFVPLACALVTGVFTLLTLWLSYLLNDKADAVERVAPLTDYNIGLLSVEETLVRSSDAPPIERKAELLRAVQSGQETPPEHLLRAGQGGAE